MKKTLCVITLLCLLASALPGMAEGGAAPVLTERTVEFYYGDPETSEPRTVYFVEGSDVPYLALSGWQDLVRAYLGLDSYTAQVIESGGLSFAFSMAGNTGVLTREDGYTAAFDCDADTLRFLDYDAFLKLSSGDYLTEMVGSLQSSPDGPVRYLQRADTSYQRYGSEVVIDAAAYGIDFIARDGECYVPMQTLCDFLMGTYYCCIFWNGEIAVVGSPDVFGRLDALTPMGEMYYSVAPRARSEAMASFAYGELCMALDNLYGMKQSHGITRFDDMLNDTGLKPELTDTDALRANAGLYQLLYIHLDEMHSAFRLPSPLAGLHAADNFRQTLGYGLSRGNDRRQYDLYLDTRRAAYPDGVPSYEEIGNTAYITLDHFTSVPDGVDYYQTPPTAEAEDTVGIMIYAYAQITREGSPVENVVLDLSCNGGGMADAALFTMAAFLGTGSLSTRNTLAGALVTGSYAIDINLDGAADEGDQALLGKNLFCIESPVSFSCGNLVPCAFKASNLVSLLGRPSGGGACFVQALSTADGACCQISGATQMSFLKNGAFYDIDRGAEPDLPLLKVSSFYDRQALTAYIDQVR